MKTQDSLQPVRGTKDLLEKDYALHSHVIDTVKRVASLYGFQSVALPIFESSAVFSRTLGETSDVVMKEMYSFDDKGGNSLTLRPEFTASMARAFISHGLHYDIPCKWLSYGPLFRYERPQEGRQRQFHQWNIEYIGGKTPQSDIEIIALSHHILHALDLDKKVTLELNSLGDTESRYAYRDALRDYFAQYLNDLSPDSQMRLERNPLRILDSKNEKDKEIAKEAPCLQDYYTQTSKNIWESLQEGLILWNIPYTINPRLVRGLDYYVHTAFEWTTTHLGAQGTVIGGGRYDGLIEQMGGVPMPAIGCAGGIERLCSLISENPIPAFRRNFLFPISENEADYALKWLQHLRHLGVRCEYEEEGSVSKRLKKASKKHAFAVFTCGEKEMFEQSLSLRLMDSGKEYIITKENCDSLLKELLLQ